MTRTLASSLALGWMVAAAACSPKVSDTGYVGTWVRGNGNSRSMVSISKIGDQYHFHWKLTSLDGQWTAKCDAGAHCVEIAEGKKIGEYQFSTRIDSATGHLIVESDQTSFGPNGEVHAKTTDLDELVVEDNGLKLGSYVVERNGQKFSGAERPQRHFDKISDAVLEPGL